MAASLVLASLTAAVAQQPQRRPSSARPSSRAQPAPAAPPAEPPQIVELKGEPTQKDWIKICGKDPSVNAEVCYTTRGFRVRSGSARAGPRDL